MRSDLLKPAFGTRFRCGYHLAMVAQHRPGLVLLDLNLPGMGGLEILDKISKQYPDTRVIIVTTQSTMHTVKEAARLGAVGYILKHNPKAEALASLRELLDGMDGEGDEEKPAS